MTWFRLTIGENGTPWGKQKVLRMAEANNAIEFLKECKEFYPNEVLKNTWVDAGNDTIALPVQSLKY